MKLADLAAIAGVSTATVSRALAGHPSVARETRERIRALAQQYEVRPNQLARNLRLRSTGAIGVAMPLGHAPRQQLTDPFFLTLLGFLADRLVERGYDILLSRVLPRGGQWLDELVDSGRIDGLILIGQSDQFETIERVAARYAPLVVWGVNRVGQRHVAVGSDNITGGRLAASHLTGLGRRRLLFVGDPAPPEFAERLVGFCDGAAQHGAHVDVLDTAMQSDAVFEATSRWLARGIVPDAVFAASDVAAMAVMRAVAASGRSVPRDIAVIGYDDIPLAATTVPSLTTIRQDLGTGATLMVDRLFALIAGEEAAPAIVPPQVVARGSTPAG